MLKMRQVPSAGWAAVFTLGAALCTALQPLALAAPPNTSASIEPVPPNVGSTGNNKPMMMLVASKDHTLFGPMYTDFEDLDGDGILDVTFKPNFKYYGYFDATKCYTYANSQFEPNSTATVTGERYVCGGSGQWSGNFLNWATMTRLDVVRKILYGGQRSTDTATATTLQTARLSRDSHSFVKYYRGTDIRDYTPFSTANLTKTAGNNANVYAGLTMCVQAAANDNGATGTPQIRMARGNYRMWATVEGGTVCEWGSGALGNKLSRYYGGTAAYQGNGGVNHESNPPNETNDGAKYSGIGPTLNARVKVCVSDKLGDESCQAYGSGSSTVYKPVGLLQKFGTPLAGAASARAEFGLITGSYDQNLTAGALRKNIRDVLDEINPANGRFCFSASGVCSGTTPDGRSYTSSGAIKALDSIVLYGKTGGNYDGSNVQLPSELTNGTLSAWGNPVGEMMVQALLYYGAKTSTNPSTTTRDTATGLPVATWTDPMSDADSWRTSQYGKGVCRPLNLLALSSGALSFDGNSADADTPFGTLPNRSRGSLSAFTDAVGSSEGIAGTLRSVGNVSGTWGEECSAKTVSSLSSVTGICPEAPAIGGTYKIAGAALYANTNRIRTISSPPSDLPDTALKVKTYAASLAGGAARVEVPVPGTSPQRYVYITPEGLWSANYDGKKMPAAMLTFNAISSSATHGAFMVTWNDSLFGGDYDMDIAGYLRYDIVTSGSTKQLRITTDIVNVGAGWTGSHGFSVIGTNRDGRYITHRHGATDAVMNTTPGYLCGVAAYRNSTNLSTVAVPANGVFPGIPAGAMGNFRGDHACRVDQAWNVVQDRDSPVSITLDMVGADSVTLREPLWYAAKYGSFNPTSKTDNSELPNQRAEWDVERNDGAACSGADCQDGEPDGYFLGRRPELLEKRLEALLRKISSSSNAAPAVSSPQPAPGGFGYAANFSNDNLWGTVEAFRLSADGRFSKTPSWNGSLTLGNVAHASRNVITNLGATGADFTKSGLGGATSAAYVALRSSGTEAQTDELINHVRGDATNEAAPGTSGKLWRHRAKDKSAAVSTANPRYLMGTIVNSTPWLQAPPSGRELPNYGSESKYSDFVSALNSRQNLLWVGANDGMLHAFVASGAEAGTPLVSYVPSPMLGRLRALSLAANNSVVAGVDGSPYTADVFAGSSWKTYLFSSLGRGGKAVFALDATDTASIGASNFKWMFSSDDDADLGYMLSEPRNHPDTNQATTVVRMANGKFALLVPNGINSTNGKGFLYVLFVDGPSTGAWTAGTHYVKLATDTATANGLMGVTWADTDRDGKADFIYGTDLLGRLWKFDVRSPNASTWGAGTLLFEAKDGTNRLPVSTSPVVSFPGIGGVMVGFGTGKSIFTGDFPNANLTQRFYSIYDNVTTSNPGGRTTAVNSDLSRMAKRVAKTTATGGAYIESASEVTGSVNLSKFDPVVYDGWYLNFPALASGTANNEMVIGAPEIAIGNLFFTTVRPNTGSNQCFSSALTRVWAIDPIVGTPKVTNFGVVTLGGFAVNLAAVDGKGIQRGTPVIVRAGGKSRVTMVGIDESGAINDDLRGAEVSPSRIQWREVPNMRTLD